MSYIQVKELTILICYQNRIKTPAVYVRPRVLVKRKYYYNQPYYNIWSDCYEKDYELNKSKCIVYGEWSSYYKNYKYQSLSTCVDYYDYNFDAHNSVEDSKSSLYCYPRVLYDYHFDIYKYIYIIIN